MRARPTPLLAVLAALLPAAAAAAQTSLEDLPALARARAERLRPKQVAALEPFWADLSLDYGNNREFLDRRVVEAARLGDSVVPLLLEKLQPGQSSEAAQNLAGNCRRVLERLDPGSFVDALAELTRGSSSVARSEAIRLLGFARVPQAVAVLVDLADEVRYSDRLLVLQSLRRLEARSAAPKIAPLLGASERGVREAVLAYLVAARADQVAPIVIQALSAESVDRLLPSYIDYFAACVRRDEAAATALLPLLERDRIDWQDTLSLVKALADVAPERHEPTMRKLHEMIDSNDTSSIAVYSAVSLRALGDKNGVTRMKRALDDKLRRRKREASLYEQRASLLYAIGDFGDASDDYEKILQYADGAAMSRRAYQGLLRCESRRRKIQNVVKYMKASGMSPDEFERLARYDEPFREAMKHDRVQSYLKILRRTRAPK